MGCPDWHTAMRYLSAKTFVDLPSWASRSQRKDRANKLASTVDILSGLQFGKVEMLRGLRNFLNMDRPEHHSKDCLKERGVENESSQYSALQGREWSEFNQTNICTVLRATLRRLQIDRVEQMWAFPSATMPSWAETETETVKPSLEYRVLILA